jgi:hypothetical protein
MMEGQWTNELRLKVEALVDEYVTAGASQSDVLDVIAKTGVDLRIPNTHAPERADNKAVVEEPANDWPAAT